MKYTEKDIKKIIAGLLSDNENELGFELKPEAVESLNKDYEDGQFGELTSMEDYIDECLYDYVIVNFPVTEVVEAIESREDATIGKITVEHIGIEAIVRMNNDFMKCFPATNGYIETKNYLFYDLELNLERAGYKPLRILENGTKVMIKSSGVIGIIGGNDLDNSEEDLSDLNYYVIPEGKTFNDEIMVHKDEIRLVNNEVM